MKRNVGSGLTCKLLNMWLFKICPVNITSPDLAWSQKKQPSNEVFGSKTTSCSIKSAFSMRGFFADNFTSKYWPVMSLSSTLLQTQSQRSFKHYDSSPHWTMQHPAFHSRGEFHLFCVLRDTLTAFRTFVHFCLSWWACSWFPQYQWLNGRDLVPDKNLVRKFCVKKNKIFPSETFGIFDGQDISKTTTSQCPSKFNCSGKKSVNKLSVLSGECFGGKLFAAALKTNCTASESFVKWL